MTDDRRAYETTSPDTAIDLAAIQRRVSWRILPFLLLGYALAYLDRVNIGFAKFQLQADIGLSNAAYGLGAGIFFVGYVIFEVPSNLLLERIGARRTFARIMILWGATSAAMACVQDAWSFYALRFLLGVFESGFGPGIVFYLTCWYPRRALARVLAIILLAGPAGGALGGPLSTGIMEMLDGMWGLAGWQWLFIAEGLPCVVLGVITPFYLSDSPRQARWLTDRESAALETDIAAGRPSEAWADVLRSPKTYVLALGYACLISAMYGFSFWLPTLLRDMGVVQLTTIGFYAAVPYVLAILVMLLAAMSSDRSGDRRWHSAGLAAVAALMLGVSTALPGTNPFWFAAIAVSIALIWAAYSVFWALACEMLGSGRAAAGGIALINSIGLVGGGLSPAILGWIKEGTGSLTIGLLFLTGLLCAASLIIALFARTPKLTVSPRTS